VSNGTGPDSIVLQVSENAWANGGKNADANGDAEFTVAVNGVQQGGTYTALAPHGTAEEASNGSAINVDTNSNFHFQWYLWRQSHSRRFFHQRRVRWDCTNRP
jgi:hypothetical protein